MASNQTQFLEKLQSIISHGFQNAARGISGMVGEELLVANPSVAYISIKEIPNVLGGPENDAVGIYLRMEGDITGQIMLIFPYARALEIADLVLELEFGTTQQLSSLERSALAEVGNMTAAFFMNAISEMTGLAARPSPPAVMVDMVGAILDVIVAAMGPVMQNVLMFQTTLVRGGRQTEGNFWIIPDPGTLDKLISAGSGM